MNNTGCRPLTDSEFDAILNVLNGNFRLRNAALLTLGRYTGYRISEMLSLKVEAVWDGYLMRNSVSVVRENMKYKRVGRTIPLHRRAQNAIQEWLVESRMTDPKFATWPLFFSRKSKQFPREMSPANAWIILHCAAIRARVSTKNLGLHSLRKQFALAMWESRFVQKDMAKMSRLLGHSDFSSTIRYLQFLDGSLESAVLAA